MALINIGQGFIYDTSLDIIWLQNICYAQTRGAGQNGCFPNWADAVAWAKSLSIEHYVGWRLPSLLELTQLFEVEAASLAGSGVQFLNYPAFELAALWTSTEIDADNVWVINCENGQPKHAEKISDPVQGLYQLIPWPVRDGNSQRRITIPVHWIRDPFHS